MSSPVRSVPPAIRMESEADFARIDRLHETAFGRQGEARLVRALRAAGIPRIGFVATDRDRLLGHVFFSPVTIEGADALPACAGLAPLGVDPRAQGRGVGKALVRAGLAACPALGWRAVFVLGEPDYYSAFGFRLAASRGLHYESAAFDPAFQVLELEPGALEACTGRVRYHDAFDRLEET